MNSVDANLSACISAIEEIISFNTESSKSNLELIGWAEAYAHEYGGTTRRFYNREGSKATTCITVGPMVDGGVVLSGHTDVVPVEGQAWTSDPYILRSSEGKLYGRGTCDMKSFGAIALASIPEFVNRGLKRPVHIVLSYDEEITSQGSTATIEEFGKSLPRPAAIIVGEPTMMRVADTHKSISTYLTTVFGHEAHSSRPNIGANAIEGAVELVAELYRFGRDLETSVDEGGGLSPAYSTVSVGTISGGTARNILARQCSFLWEFRGLPRVKQTLAIDHLNQYCEQVVLPRLRRFTDDASVHTEIITEVPGLYQEKGSIAETLALKLSQSNHTVAMPFATEAGQFQRRGLPTVLCGPGNVDQAHQPDEYIEVSQVLACSEFMHRLATELCG